MSSTHSPGDALDALAGEINRLPDSENWRPRGGASVIFVSEQQNRWPHWLGFQAVMRGTNVVMTIPCASKEMTHSEPIFNASNPDFGETSAYP